MRVTSSWVYVVFAALIGIFFLVSTWPGWSSADTQDMMSQASTGLINDWHSPILTFLWSLTPVAQWGTGFPFMAQQVVFWSAILIMTYLTSDRFGWVGLVVPLVAVSLDYAWTTVWVWKDATAASLVAISLALAFLALRSNSLRKLSILISLSTIALSSIFLARWYMFPTLICGLLTIGLMAKAKWLQISSSKRLSHFNPNFAAGKVILVGVLVMFGLALFQNQVVKPEKSFALSSVQILDIGRVECRQGRYPFLGTSFLSQDSPQIPKALVYGDRALCESFDSLNVGSFLWPAPNYSGVKYLNLTENERDSLRGEWISAWVTGFHYLIADRMRLGISFLDRSDAVTAVSSGIFDRGADVELLDISRAPASLVGDELAFGGLLQSAFIYVVGLPLGLLLWASRSKRMQLWIIFGAVFPVIWIINFSLVAPGPDSRFVAPAVIWGLFFTTGSFVLCSQKKVETKGL